jgi:hypothetical protein
MDGKNVYPWRIFVETKIRAGSNINYLNNIILYTRQLVLIKANSIQYVIIINLV